MLAAREIDVYKRKVRDYEYEAIMAIALEALDYSSHVLVNAPFNRELRDEEYLRRLRETLAGKGAKLTVVWVHTDIAVSYTHLSRFDYRGNLIDNPAQQDLEHA